MNDTTRNILKWSAAVGIGYGLYKVFVEDDAPVSVAVTSPVQTAVKVVEAPIKKVSKLMKGSPEAKAHMALMRSKVKHHGRKKKTEKKSKKKTWLFKRTD
ncbi:hypothetical protein [Candidatus Magnetobacterium casense]|uniref:Uncharacterized protein n=1 Tax=Candidatus Magnetobacterium casense TaxID=1455061 RepID=A0ABS6RUQ1_9BACT|nr:hypothetical protein [Candidatus Magnetobacterium casensis]MBV6340356.1 hypothetical protein [Candidatus Magnetobacterium casensis]